MSRIIDNLDRMPITGSDISVSPDALISARSQNELLEHRLGKAKAYRFEIDTALRKHIAYCFTFIIYLWLASVISILYFNNNLLDLNLSDNVLITLLTTTSINVIGMMLIILKNLFPQKDNSTS